MHRSAPSVPRRFPPLNGFDIGYTVVGAVLCLLAFQHDLLAALVAWLVCLLSYVVGRGVGASHS